MFIPKFPYVQYFGRLGTDAASFVIGATLWGEPAGYVISSHIRISSLTIQRMLLTLIGLCLQFDKCPCSDCVVI
jgi:hypothetical protein